MFVKSLPKPEDFFNFRRSQNRKLTKIVRSIVLLTASNILMTFAWKAILLSWFIAFFEYCLMVPDNRIGFAGELKSLSIENYPGSNYSPGVYRVCCLGSEKDLFKRNVS